MVYTLLTIVHVLVCLFLIVVVLLQSGKAADLAGAFGGMGSQTAFGPRGSATLLSKATTGSAILFMVTSLSLSIMATKHAGAGVGNTILDKHPAPASTKQPGTSTTTLPTSLTPGAPVAPNVPIAPAGGAITITPGEGPAKPGQPSVTLSDPRTGEQKTIPLNIQTPPNGAPPQKAPPKK
jgi:preprotein translocase subunit SecG